MKNELAITIEDALEVGLLVEIVIDALDGNYPLTVVTNDKGLILQHLRVDFDGFMSAERAE
jgi:hypothetical protein